jgi:quercetin dioxygenase-like cupin family protein
VNIYQVTTTLAVFFFTGIVSAQVNEPQERVLRFDDMEARNPAPGIDGRSLFADTVRLISIKIEKGSKSNHHNHADEQIVIVNSGLVKAQVRDKEYTMKAGDMIVIPSWVPHQFEALEASEWMEVHGPGFSRPPGA